MNKKNKTKLIVLFSILFFIAGYFSISSFIGTDKFKSLFSFLNLSPKQKLVIKKYIFPFALISEQEKAISEKQNKISVREQEKLKLKKLFHTFLYDLELKKKVSYKIWRGESREEKMFERLDIQTKWRF